MAGLAASGPALAATYYVSPTGSDSNAGSASAPWRTIQKAANTATAGDTVLVRGGTYQERVSITRSGAAGRPIIFKNESSTPAIIDGGGLSAPDYSSLVTISNASYVQISGLVVRKYGDWCVAVVGTSTNVDLDGLDVSGCSNSAVWIDTKGTAPNFIKVRNSKVHDNQSGGITVWLSPGGYILIEGNEAWNNAGAGNYDGIQVGGGNGATHHVVVRANKAWDNGQGAQGADQIDLGGHGPGDFYLVEDNEVWGAGGEMKVQQAYGATTVIARRNRLNNFGFVIYGFPTPAVYYNNTIVGSRGHAVQFYSDQVVPPPGKSLGGFEFKNNLVLESGNYLLLLNGIIDVRYSSMRLANNLYKCTGKGIAWVPRIFDCQNPDAAGQSEFAAYQAANPPDLQDVGSRLTTAALTSIFANPGARDYHLIAGSPAIDAAAPLTRATAAGTNSTTIPVVRADYFQDGWRGLVAPDQVVVGSNQPVQVTGVNDAANTITVATPITWKQGDAVTLPYVGTAPDSGAFEFGSGGTQAGVPSPPALLDVEVQS